MSLDGLGLVTAPLPTPPTLGPMEMADIVIVIAAVLAVTLVLLNAWFDKPSADGTRAPRKHANR